MTEETKTEEWAMAYGHVLSRVVSGLLAAQAGGIKSSDDHVMDRAVQLTNMIWKEARFQETSWREKCTKREENEANT